MISVCATCLHLLANSSKGGYLTFPDDTLCELCDETAEWIIVSRSGSTPPTYADELSPARTPTDPSSPEQATLNLE